MLALNISRFGSFDRHPGNLLSTKFNWSSSILYVVEKQDYFRSRRSMPFIYLLRFVNCTFTRDRTSSTLLGKVSSPNLLNIKLQSVS
jgi:hypothetical protein